MTGIVYKYELYCITEGIYKYVWNKDTPTECPNDPSDIISENSRIINMRFYKNLTYSNSPYIVSNGFYYCDTTGGNIEMRFNEASRAIYSNIYLCIIAGANNVELYNNNDLDAFHTIVPSTPSTMYRVESNGSIWECSLDDNSNDTLISKNNGVMQSSYIENIINEYYNKQVYNKGDIVTSDNQGKTLLPVGLDGQVLYSDSSAKTGLKWDYLKAFGNIALVDQVNGDDNTASINGAKCISSSRNIWTTCYCVYIAGNIYGTVHNTK